MKVYKVISNFMLMK